MREEITDSDEILYDEWTWYLIEGHLSIHEFQRERCTNGIVRSFGLDGNRQWCKWHCQQHDANDKILSCFPSMNLMSNDGKYDIPTPDYKNWSGPTFQCATHLGSSPAPGNRRSRFTSVEP
jgi:hypothetical protein